MVFVRMAQIERGESTEVRGSLDQPNARGQRPVGEVEPFILPHRFWQSDECRKFYEARVGGGVAMQIRLPSMADYRTIRNRKRGGQPPALSPRQGRVQEVPGFSDEEDYLGWRSDEEVERLAGDQ